MLDKEELTIGCHFEFDREMNWRLEPGQPMRVRSICAFAK